MALRAASWSPNPTPFPTRNGKPILTTAIFNLYVAGRTRRVVEMEMQTETEMEVEEKICRCWRILEFYSGIGGMVGTAIPGSHPFGEYLLLLGFRSLFSP